MGQGSAPDPTCWVHLTAGVGPVECHFVVARVLAALTAEAQAAGAPLALLAAEPGEAPDTLRSALLSAGAGAEALLATWEGTIQWSGRSPFRANHPRRNFFVGVEVLALPATPVFHERDLVFATLRSSGPGGQHVNKTESAVRVTHTPTGLSVVAREERSQHQNRRLALARLAALIAAQASQAQSEAERARWRQHHQLVRGNPVRVYKGADFKRTA